jgi:ABC-type ATPase with predicted acetyltransferase domain
MWEKVDDNNVIMVWQCRECGDTVDIDPCFYECNGTPVCIECDEDMAYRHTQIYNNLTEKIM